MSATVIHIGHCVCCRKMRALDGGPACRWCRAVHGRRFVEVAHRFRTDPDFAERVMERMSPAQVEMLHEYFVDPPKVPPRGTRGPLDG